MKFQATPLPGVFTIDLEPQRDARGFFARAFCMREFAGAGILFPVVQASISRTITRGSLRGMHYRNGPPPEPKLVRCIRGAVWDVVVDLRPASPTFGQHVAAKLSAANGRAMVVPPGCAHGFQSLTDHAETLYLAGSEHIEGSEAGIRFDDPSIGIRWPLPVRLIHPRDLSWPLLPSRKTLLITG
jgi:dTDP-4-dehydrorhamnose 3,5-epimerase